MLGITCERSGAARANVFTMWRAFGVVVGACESRVRSRGEGGEARCTGDPGDAFLVLDLVDVAGHDESTVYKVR